MRECQSGLMARSAKPLFAGSYVTQLVILVFIMKMRVSYNGITTAFQADDESSILSTRSKFKTYALLAEWLKRRIANPVFAGSIPRTVLQIYKPPSGGFFCFIL